MVFGLKRKHLKAACQWEYLPMKSRFDNADKKFDLDNENSPLKNLLKPNRRIQAWLGAEIEKTWGTIKTKPWGEYKEV